MRRPPLIGWPATLLPRASQRREHRHRPAGPGGGSPQPTIDQTCKCSTFVLRLCFLLLKMSLCYLARRRTSTPTKSRSRGRPSLLPPSRTPRRGPQSSLRRRPLLQLQRGNLPRRVPQQALRRGVRRQRGPVPRVLCGGGRQSPDPSGRRGEGPNTAPSRGLIARGLPLPGPGAGDAHDRGRR